MANHDLTIYRNRGGQILANLKNLEVRIGYESIKRIQVDDRIRFFNRTHEIWVRVLDKRHYLTFEDMLSHEDHRRIAPELSRENLLQGLRQLFSPTKERLGVYVIEFKKE